MSLPLRIGEPSHGPGHATPRAKTPPAESSLSPKSSRHSLRSVFSCPTALTPTTLESRPQTASKDCLSPEPQLHGAARHHLHRRHDLHTTGSHGSQLANSMTDPLISLARNDDWTQNDVNTLSKQVAKRPVFRTANEVSYRYARESASLIAEGPGIDLVIKEITTRVKYHCRMS